MPRGLDEDLARHLPDLRKVAAAEQHLDGFGELGGAAHDRNAPQRRSRESRIRVRSPWCGGRRNEAVRPDIGDTAGDHEERNHK
ncbi:hypothetical protein AQJ46_46690 [Streptomyces canus]|uniref:Uncharacterized protein n=1 Tax=Streptomyces canus TaxID=58343 RepID=A0A101RL56_9ACTN|nr:hypothetical protein [Streptomyces canus]KUN57558.1 hypothetical protein AQJ46_46690 [Streptomyces canus]